MQGSGTSEGRATMVAAPARRRQRGGAREVATPLAATFLGLLMVQSFRPALADEAEAARSGGSSAGEGGSTERSDGTAGLDAGGAMHLAGVPAIAPGSVLAAGGLIDPAALTRLSGSARFAEPATAPPSGAAGLLPGGAGETAAPAAVALGAAGAIELALPELPTIAGTSAVTTDPDLANLGTYQRGSDLDQTVTLTPKDDVFLGGSGDEHVLGLEGDDQLSGGGGNDVLEGGAGDDALDGGTGDDMLDGGSGNDKLDGGSGDDLLTGGTGDDRLDGETGSDVLVLDDPTDTIKEMGLGIDLGGIDTVVVKQSYADGLAKALPGLSPAGQATFVLGTPAAADFPAGLAGYRQQIDPDIENIRLEGSARHDVVAGAGANLIEGNLAANRLYGGGGDDRILGGAGDDWLDGGDGDDWLEGGEGADTLYGGGGDDVYVLGLHESADQVFDHEGSNSLRLATAEPDRVAAELRGSDLAITFDGRTLATVKDYAGHESSFAGIDLGQGVQSFDTLLGDHSAGAATLAGADDWLAGFLTEEAADVEPLADPWTLAGVSEPGSGAGASAGLAASTLQEAAPASFLPLELAHPDLAGGDLWLAAESLPEAPFDAALIDGSAAAGEGEAARPEERQTGA